MEDIMKKYAANIITCFRIILSIVMLFFPTFSFEFFVVYLLCGLTDMIDGTVARKTNSVTVFGSKLDTIADIVFILTAFIKIIPVIEIPVWILRWGCMIAFIKIMNILSGFIYKKRFMVEHTIMNKITGALLFLFPLTFHCFEIRYTVVIICIVATFAAIQEGYYILAGIEIEDV